MKKLLFIMSIFISINLSLLAASGFEGIINIPDINNATYNNGSLGTITLSFNIVEKTN